MEEIEALQLFVTNCGKGNLMDRNLPDHVSSASPRVQLLPTTYYWMYPPNSVSIPQSQSINKIMNISTILPSNEKRNITEIFSRTNEWYQKRN
jgi:hypothetical protein